jgi:DNA-binding phage protein
MSTSQMQLDQELSEPEIKKFWLGYFQEAFREDVHQQLLEGFEDLKASSSLTRMDLARKIGRRPEQLTRWLSAPNNLEMDTISDMALGMGLVPKIRFEPVRALFNQSRPNLTNPVSEFVATRAAGDSKIVVMRPSGPLASTNAYSQSDLAVASGGA